MHFLQTIIGIFGKIPPDAVSKSFHPPSPHKIGPVAQRRYVGHAAHSRAFLWTVY
jgi:hypothetical protein